MKLKQKQKLVKKQLFFRRQRISELTVAAEAVLKEGTAKVSVIGSEEEITE